MLLENVQVELNNAISHVRAEGQAQLAKAELAADRYGDKSKTLSEMAEQAKLLADRQEERNKEIKALAERARNASKEALNEANEAIFGGTCVSRRNTDHRKSSLFAISKSLSIFRVNFAKLIHQFEVFNWRNRCRKLSAMPQIFVTKFTF